jgi:hypothetical protein
MKWPFCTRANYEELDARIKDLERHFVTKRDESGKAIETLADVPLEERKEREHKLRGLSWPQRKAMLEATDGGRIKIG